MQNKQSLIAANIQISDLNAELNQLLGLPLDKRKEGGFHFGRLFSAPVQLFLVLGHFGVTTTNHPVAWHWYSSCRPGTLQRVLLSFFLNGTVLSQPVTQLLKIHEATGIARSDQKVAEADAKKAENDVTLAVHQLYYSLLVARKQKEAAEAGLKAAEESRREAENAVRSRNLLEVEHQSRAAPPSCKTNNLL